MIQCRNCINWVDESLEQIEADHNAHPHIFMGCRIYGFLEKNEDLPECKHYVASENLFTICSSCRITVPKVCVSLGECVNCVDTDLFCIESCKGGESRKYCTHFVRLHTEGMQIIDNDQVFDLFPAQGMPGKDKSIDPGTHTVKSPKAKAAKNPPSGA
jgi:hypothetical protein